MPKQLPMFPAEPAPDDETRKDKDEGMLQSVCSSALRSAYPQFRETEIEACFYPYIGLTHTIRRKGSGWRVRISDHCRQASRPVLEAIAMILGSKIARRRAPRKYLEAYESYCNDPAVVESVRKRRRRIGRKHFAGRQGMFYFPRRLFKDINKRFFNNQIEIRRIGWGVRKGLVRLGHYDPIHHTIMLSPALDSPKVPEYVVRFIIYHEMLHAVFEESPGFRKHHPPQFRRAERAYPDFERATKFIREFFGRRRKSIDD